ncbi:hypothetical protein Rhal01_02890 [Rubritalea halochordaticola]|uniref:Ice-binding protein C-terminal domain-containing protein n=1 Tax=Rubritalea halochordaticola TaxID=714537 RepID=A0ABP9V3V7_9BACT
MKKTTLLSLTLAAATASSQAAIVVQENFDYADGPVATLNGGTGFSGAWDAGNSTGTRLFNVSSGSAIYNGGGNGTVTVQSRDFATGYTVDTSTTLTISFDLIVNETQAGRGIGINLVDSVGGNSVFLGKRINGSYGAHSGITAGSTTYSNSGATGSMLLTAVFTSNGTDTFVDVQANGGSVVSGTITGTQFAFDSLELTGYHGSTVSNGVDNISIDVTTTAVPEPSSTSLIGLAGVALLLRRRR